MYNWFNSCFVRRREHELIYREEKDEQVVGKI
jgi:hypothetical protein